METRELFERLIDDEPPLRISPSAAAAAGRRTQGRRYAGVAGVLVAVVVVGSGVVVEAQHGTSTATGPAAASPSATGSATPTTPAVPSFAFTSAAHINASNARVYGLLVPYAGGAVAITSGSPLWQTAPITDKTQFVATQAQYRNAAGTGMLRVVTDTAAEAKTRYGGLLSGDLCAALKSRSTDEGTFVGCTHEALNGGGSVWTYARKESTPGEITSRESTSALGPAIYERDAIVVAKDGSALNVLFQELDKPSGGQTPVPLTDDMRPTLPELRALARDAAVAWQPTAGDIDPTRSATPVVSAPADTGFTTLRFTSGAQVTAAQSKAFAAVAAAGEQEGPLTMQTPPPSVTALPKSVEAQVRLATTAADVYLHLTVVSAADSAAIYGKAVTQGPCLGDIPNRALAVHCQRDPLPGGGTEWTSEVTQPYLPQGGIVSSSTPIVTMQRLAMVVGTDGSVLEVMEYAELPNDGDDVQLPAAGTLSGPAITALARTAAAAWVSG